MMKKGWTWTMILEAISIIMGLIQVVYNPTSVVGIILPVIIVIYLWMKKDLFK